jgi:hypothetical protein
MNCRLLTSDCRLNFGAQTNFRSNLKPEMNLKSELYNLQFHE